MPTIPDDFEIFAWVGPDETGTFGIAAGVTPLGIAPAVTQKHENANTIYRGGVQARCDALGADHYLIRLTKDGIETIETLHPRIN